jgi:dolichol-phosphate mannosyltransferase
MGTLKDRTKLVSCDLTVVVPALNEEGNLSSTLEGLLGELTLSRIDAEVVVFNDGSEDRTGEIAEQFAKTDHRVRVINHKSPRGIGASFVEALREARGKYITWFPGDGENDPGELLKYWDLLKYVDIIVPFVVNKNVRPRKRRIISSLFLLIINLSFGTSFNYTSGNIIYRTELLRKIRIRETGFLCSTEMLLRLAKAGALYAEVPVLIRPMGRKSGSSKAFSPRSIINVFTGYILLFLDIHFCK